MFKSYLRLCDKKNIRRNYKVEGIIKFLEYIILLGEINHTATSKEGLHIRYECIFSFKNYTNQKSNILNEQFISIVIMGHVGGNYEN